MAIEIVRNNIIGIPVIFYDITQSGVYSGSSLTNHTIVSLVYDDDGNESVWPLSNTFVSVGGNYWILLITESESNQSQANGIITVTADEIQPAQVSVEFITRGAGAEGGGGGLITHPGMNGGLRG